MNVLRNFCLFVGLFAMICPILLQINQIYSTEINLSLIPFISLYAGAGLITVAIRWEDSK
jgi:hypothetical protein